MTEIEQVKKEMLDLKKYLEDVDELSEGQKQFFSDDIDKLRKRILSNIDTILSLFDKNADYKSQILPLVQEVGWDFKKYTDSILDTVLDWAKTIMRNAEEVEKEGDGSPVFALRLIHAKAQKFYKEMVRYRYERPTIGLAKEMGERMVKGVAEIYREMFTQVAMLDAEDEDDEEIKKEIENAKRQKEKMEEFLRDSPENQG